MSQTLLRMPSMAQPHMPESTERIARLAKKLAQRIPSQPTSPISFVVQSEDIDDRVGRLINEINNGKKDVNVRRIVADILRGRNPKNGKWNVPPRAWQAEIKALFKYVIENVRYTLDPYQLELFQSPNRSLELGIGDCDDICILLGSLLVSAGYPVRVRIIALKGHNDFSHVYLLAGVPPHNPTYWMPLDASREDHLPGWEFPRSKVGKVRDYEVSDQEGIQ